MQIAATPGNSSLNGAEVNPARIKAHAPITDKKTSMVFIDPAEINSRPDSCKLFEVNKVCPIIAS